MMKLLGHINFAMVGAGNFVLVVLKLTDVIDWSWWLVTAPAWGFWLAVMAAAVYKAFVHALNEVRKSK
jgi:uncharacterized membrane protein (DUF2068 family)